MADTATRWPSDEAVHEAEDDDARAEKDQNRMRVLLKCGGHFYFQVAGNEGVVHASGRAHVPAQNATASLIRTMACCCCVQTLLSCVYMEAH